MRSIAGPARTWTSTSFDRLTRIMPPLRSGPLGPWLSRQRPSSSRSRYPTSISTPSPPTTSCAHGACRSESAITRAGCALVRSAGNSNALVISYSKGLSRHGPAERLGHGFVEVGDETFNALLEMFFAGEVSTAQELANENGEPDLDLINPGCVLRCKMKDDAVAAVAEKRLAGFHRGKYAGLGFLAQIVRDTAQPCNQLDHAFGDVRVEIVADDVPGRRRCGAGEQVVQECDVVCLGAAVADHTAHRAGGDIEGRDQRLRAMPDILELAPFNMSRLHRQARRGALQGLDAGHLVDRDGPHALLCSGRSRLIDRADVGALGVEVGVRLRRQPVTAEMRLEIRTFLKSARPSRA